MKKRRNLKMDRPINEGSVERVVLARKLAVRFQDSLMIKIAPVRKQPPPDYRTVKYSILAADAFNVGLGLPASGQSQCSPQQGEVPLGPFSRASGLPGCRNILFLGSSSTNPERFQWHTGRDRNLVNVPDSSLDGTRPIFPGRIFCTVQNDVVSTPSGSYITADSRQFRSRYILSI